MIAKHPERYGFLRAPVVEPFAADSVTVPDATSLEVISRVSGIPLADLVDLNPHYVRLVTPPGRQSLVRVPVGRASEVAAALAGLPRPGPVPLRHRPAQPLHQAGPARAGGRCAGGGGSPSPVSPESNDSCTRE